MSRLHRALSLFVFLGLVHACGGDAAPPADAIRDAVGDTPDAAPPIDVRADIAADAAPPIDVRAPDTAPDEAPGVDTRADTASDTPGDAVSDAAPPAPADARADVALPPPPTCLGDDLLVTREGTNGDVSFRLDRCMPSICGGGCPVYSPQLTVVTPDRTCVALSDDIVYTKTHHNWGDSLVATLSDVRVTWRVEFDFDEGMVELHYVAIESIDGAPVLAETLFRIEPY